MKDLPDYAFMRLPTVLKAYPVSETLWWEGVKNGEFPLPYKLSKGVSAWLVKDIRKLCEDRAKQPREITA